MSVAGNRSGPQGILAQTRFAQEAKLDYGLALKSRGREDGMADAGTIRRVDAGTLTRADLADVVHREIGLSRAESAGIVERILHHMCAALSDGHNVKISGFGSFILRDKGERVGRNPKTGVEVPIAPRRVLTFRASQIMRERIAKGG
jgi:integration host factor subunit alpha